MSVRIKPGEQPPPTGLEVQRSRALEEQVKQDTGGSACDAAIIQIGALLASEDIRQLKNHARDLYELVIKHGLLSRSERSTLEGQMRKGNAKLPSRTMAMSMLVLIDAAGDGGYIGSPGSLVDVLDMLSVFKLRASTEREPLAATQGTGQKVVARAESAAGVVDVDEDEEAGTRALAKSATLLSSALLAQAPETVMTRIVAEGFLKLQDGSGKLSEEARNAQGLRVLDKAAEGRVLLKTPTKVGARPEHLNLNPPCLATTSRE
jgi:hypothetical protein